MLKRHAPQEKILARLSPLLESEDHEGLEAALVDIGLDEVCGRTFIDFCRMRREAPMARMACTLGVANGIDAAWCQRILDLYQSAASVVPRGFLAPLPANHVLRQALACWHGGKDLPLPPNLQGRDRVGRDEDVELAVEFLLDHERPVAATALVLERWQAKVADRHKLMLVELLLRRQSFRHQDWGVLQHWNRVYEHVARVLMKKHEPALRDLREQLVLVIGENLLRSPEPMKALSWSRQARQPRSRIKAEYHEAHACCRVGEIPRAIECLDSMLGRLMGEPLSWIQSNFRAPGGNATSKRSFNLDAARMAMTDLRAALSPVGLKPFLVSGTLLGYARCGDFLSHDKDIDVGIYGSEDCYSILQALTASARFRIHTQFMRMGRNYSLACWHAPTGMPIDIFMYHREGDRLMTGVQTDLGYLQRFAFSPFELQEIEFVGIPMHAPSDIDLNLRENFGDWTVPDPLYISHLESPSTENPGGDIHMLVGRLTLLKAIIKEHGALGERVLQVLRRHADSRFAISPTLLKALESHYALRSPAMPEGDAMVLGDGLARAASIAAPVPSLESVAA